MKYLNDISRKDCVGKVFTSKSSGDFKILKYNGATDVEIQFLKTGFEMVSQLTAIRNGNVKDRYLPSVCGVGIVGAKYPTNVNGIRTREYGLWKRMLERCYSDAYKKKYPTYKGCEVSNKFKSYEYFYEWCNKQVGFSNKSWHLDKDLLMKSNKIYSESACVFLPQEINKVLVKREALRGKHPIGVCWCKTHKAFKAQVGKNKEGLGHLGYFKTELEAYNAYKTAKEIYIKEQANKWKSQIDERAYEALMKYEVSIDD